MSRIVQFSEDGLPILSQFSEEGFVDCVFRITDLTRVPGILQFKLFASHAGSAVGFGVEMIDQIDGFFDEDMKGIRSRVKPKGVTFKRIGIESDLLIQALANLYEMDPPARMRDQESFTALALHQGGLDINSEGVKIKLFGRDGDPFVENDYYESFFNVDLPEGFVYWNEKDNDYRAPLIRGLSEPVV
jgi:hypothetical protein